MAATLAALAARVLQRLGLRAQPTLAAGGASGPLADLAPRVMLALGLNPQGSATAPAGTITADALAARVLETLGVVDSGATPAAVDAAAARVKVDAVLQLVSAQGLGAFQTAAIPLYAAEPVRIMAAALLASSFGQQSDQAAYQAAEAQLRVAALSGTGGQSRAAEYLASVHARLVALALADWPETAIPAALDGAYVSLAVQEMSPAVGRPLDPSAIAGDEARVRQHVLTGPAGQTMAEQALGDVHRDLAARGKARWLLIDLPAHAEEPYVMMASYLLAPRVGAPANPDDWMQGERFILRAIALPSSGDPVQAEYF